LIVVVAYRVYKESDGRTASEVTIAAAARCRFSFRRWRHTRTTSAL